MAAFMCQHLFADSPVTSTRFSRAYYHHQFMTHAELAGGVLNERLIQYILRDDVSVDVKMAVINKLSWVIDGKNNSRVFLDYLLANKLYSSEEDFRKRGKGDELLAMAYLLAMDDYFKVAKAVEYADLAIAKNSASITYLVIDAIIRAQHGKWKSWCNIYLQDEEEVIWDMEIDALIIIFAYMDKYKSQVCS
jgi:hypothetical protein